MYNNIFEQTAAWQLERLGKFTASEIYKLFKSGRGKADYFGETAKSYIKSRLAEIITQESCTDLEGIAAIEHGNSYEVEAIAVFEKQTGLKVDYYGKGNPCFLPLPGFEDWAGGSPDGVTEDAVCEIKCPFNPLHHINHLLIKNGADLLCEKEQYYAQLQFNMLAAGKDKGYFISYDPRPLDYRFRLHVVEVLAHYEWRTELRERLTEAVKLLGVYQQGINQAFAEPLKNF